MDRVKPRTDAARIAAVAAENGVGLLVVGLPRNMDGSEGPMAEQAREFATLVSRRSSLPVRFEDERLTSIEAEQELRRLGIDPRRDPGAVDRMAAILMLEGFLRTRSGQDGVHNMED